MCLHSWRNCKVEINQDLNIIPRLCRMISHLWGMDNLLLQLGSILAFSDLLVLGLLAVAMMAAGEPVG